MFRDFLILCILLIGISQSGAQNLVPNYSFEIDSACPTNYGQVTYSKGWKKSWNNNQPPNQTEYCNSCNNGLFGVPNNTWGSQVASTGSAYMAQATMAPYLMTDYRENIYIQLTSPLVIGTTYNVSVMVSHTDNSQFASNNYGAKFSTVTSFPVDNHCQMHSSVVITDNINWVPVSGSFVADSAYSYICVGNFYDDAHTTNITSCPGCSFHQCGYFVDDVVVTGPSPTIPVSSFSTSGTTICLGQSTTFTSTSTGAPTSYSWNFGNSSSSNTQNPVNLYTSAGIYTATLTVSNSFGTNSSSQTITVNPPPVVSATSNSSVCPGFPANLNANGAATYSWSPPGGLSSTTGNSVSATSLTNTSYTVTGTSASGCKNTAIANVTLFPVPHVSSVSHDTICAGTSLFLQANGTGGTPAYTYSWTNAGVAVNLPVSPVTNTTYTVNCTDANGCVSTPQTSTVILHPPVSLVMTPTASICPGIQGQLGVIASGTRGGYVYSWNPSTGLSSSTIPNPTVSPSSTITYTVFVSDGCATTPVSDTTRLTVYSKPVLSFFTNDTGGCAPYCVNFNGSSNPSCVIANWKFGDGGVANGCGTVNHCYQKSGLENVTFSITDIHGCKESLAKTLSFTVYQKPSISFTVSPEASDIMNPTISFTSQIADATSWTWFFGDLSGASDTARNTQYKYLDTGCYPVTLIAKNVIGCLDTARSNVCIEPYLTFYAPNAFTPNEDGINDVWKPEGMYIDPKNYELTIYNRWGNQVFKTTTWGQGWDGRANNGSSIAQVDSYFWIVTFRDLQKTRHTYRGLCQLIK
jgi:gliding motility-associated-like protein